MKQKFFVLLVLQMVIFQWPSRALSVPKSEMQVDTLRVKKVLSDISGKILGLTTYAFQDRTTGQLYDALQDIPAPASVKLASDFNEWEYQNSLVCFGMDRVSTIFKDTAINSYTTKKIEFLKANIPFFDAQQQKKTKTPYPLYFSMKELWYCGLAANVVDVYARTKDERLKVFMQKFENHIFHVQARTTDKTLIRIDNGRKVVQSDDAYMAVIFLVRMWKLTGEERYVNEAVNQVCSYNKYLFDARDKLFHHVWYCDENRHNKQYWGRGNGWMLLSMVELLDNLPENYPHRKEILKCYRAHIKSLISLQQPNGLWCQVLNKTSSYNETSCSAMFTYSIAKGVNSGWLPKSYKIYAVKGWNGLLQKITPANEIEGVCIGTHFSDDINFYLNRPTSTNDRHVLGSFLLAGVELIKFQKTK